MIPSLTWKLVFFFFFQQDFISWLFEILSFQFRFPWLVKSILHILFGSIALYIAFESPKCWLAFECGTSLQSDWFKPSFAASTLSFLKLPCLLSSSLMCCCWNYHFLLMKTQKCDWNLHCWWSPKFWVLSITWNPLKVQMFQAIPPTPLRPGERPGRGAGRT